MDRGGCGAARGPGSVPGLQNLGGGYLQTQAVGLAAPGDWAAEWKLYIIKAVLQKALRLCQLLHRPVRPVGQEMHRVAEVLHRPGGAVLPGVDVPRLHLLVPEPEHLTQIANAAVGDQSPEHRAGPPPAVELLRMLL